MEIYNGWSSCTNNVTVILDRSCRPFVEVKKKTRKKRNRDLVPSMIVGTEEKRDTVICFCCFFGFCVVVFLHTKLW